MYEWLMDSGADLLQSFSASNEPTGFDGRLWSAAIGGGEGGGGGEGAEQ